MNLEVGRKSMGKLKSRETDAAGNFEMRSLIAIMILIILLFLVPTLFGQTEQHDVVVASIIVPLRVFDGDRFVEDLSIADLELYEDGKLQQIHSLYLTSQAQVERKEVAQDYRPTTARRFYFMFQITDFNPKITEALDYFFSQVYQPEDQVVVMTPLKNYVLSSEALQVKTKDMVVRDIQNAVRKDTSLGASEYNTLVRDLKQIVHSISAFGTGEDRTMFNLESTDSTGATTLGYLLPRYRESLQHLEELRLVDEGRFIRFANQLKRLDERKIVFFFYQREFRPEIQSATLDRLLTTNQDDHNVLAQLQELFYFYHRDINLSVMSLWQAFSDSSILFNLIFLNKQPENIAGIHMREQSEDVFKVFSQVAESTGGVVDTSQNPAAAFARASELSGRSYILYYTPQTYRRDGGFRNIVVKVKGKDYRVLHRRGYYAN
jgi:VWFA-related protein